MTGDLRRTLAVLRQCEFVVGNDTGVTHAAPMVGSKGFVLLGQAQVPIHHYAPLEGLRAAVTDQVVEGPNNLEDITPPQVIEKLKNLGWV